MNTFYMVKNEDFIIYFDDTLALGTKNNEIFPIFDVDEIRISPLSVFLMISYIFGISTT